MERSSGTTSRVYHFLVGFLFWALVATARTDLQASNTEGWIDSSETGLPEAISDSDAEKTLSLHQMRISKVSGGPYELIRVSRIWRVVPPPDVSQKFGPTFHFRHRWKQFSFSTKIVSQYSYLPKPGDDVRGILLADVCISSNYVPCTFGHSYKTLESITWTLNQLAKENLSFWVMGGDNLYDEDGSITELFFSRLSPQLLTVPLVSVPGNHDFWTRGAPSPIVTNQFGYGYAQYYMMDVEAMRGKQPDEFPFDFPEESNSTVISDIPVDTNFFHYSTIGSVGFIAFSGGHPFRVEQFARACRYFVTKGYPGFSASIVFLIGHWSTQNMGCQEDMFTSRVYDIMADPNGGLAQDCYSLVAENRLYYVDGHFHDNRVLSAFGMRVAGQGMVDTGAFGFPIVEVKSEVENQKRLLVQYVSLAEDLFDPLVKIRFAEFKRCAKVLGIFGGCLERLPFVKVWVNATVKAR